MNKSALSALEIEALTFIYDAPASDTAEPPRRASSAGTALLALASFALAALTWIGGRTGAA